MGLLTDRHFPAVEINLLNQTPGNKAWHNIYKFPQYGLNLWYSDLGANPYTGKALLLVPFINFPLKRYNNSSLYLYVGTGLAYLSKTFNVKENYQNIAISTHFNAAIRLNLKYVYSLKKTDLSLGLGLTHISNGAFKKPNLGYNIPTINLGIAYSELSKRKFLKRQIPLFTRNNNFSILFNYSNKALYPPGWKSYSAYNIQAGYLYSATLKSSLGINAELIYDRSEYEMCKRSGDTLKSEFATIKPAFSFAYCLKIEKLELQFHLGTYLWSKYKEEGYIYTRLVIRYKLTNKFFTNLSLRSHYFKADATEIGVGYNFY